MGDFGDVSGLGEGGSDGGINEVGLDLVSRELMRSHEDQTFWTLFEERLEVGYLRVGKIECFLGLLSRELLFRLCRFMFDIVNLSVRIAIARINLP